MRRRRRGEDSERDACPQRGKHHAIQLGALAGGVERRERRQRRCADRLPHHRHRHLHQLPRVREMRDHALAEQPAEPAVVPLVHRQQGLPEHQRRCDQQVAEEHAVEWRNAQPHAYATARVEPWHEKRTRARRPRVHPTRSPRHPCAAPATARRDDAAVVDERRDGGGEETPAREQRHLHDASRQEEELRRQHDARQMHGERALLAVETRELQRDERVRREPHRSRSHQCDRAERAEHGREQALGRCLPLLAAGSRVERQECDRERAPREQIVQQIGELEGGVVGVGLAAGTDPVGEQRLAREAEHAREQHAAGQQCGRRRNPRRARLVAACVVAFAHSGFSSRQMRPS